MINRREFVERAAALSGVAVLATGSSPSAGAQGTKPAVRLGERVKLGGSGITSSLIGIGTGSNGVNRRSNQTKLGKEGFVKLIRHAYDSGITFFDVADQYGSHVYLREALKHIPRDKVVIQTKTINRDAGDVRCDLDRFRMELGVEYLDTVLMHVVTEPDWNRRYQPVKDVLEEARQKGILRAHGCSCHTIEALRAAAADPWVQVDLARFNPWGAYMDHTSGVPESKTPETVKSVLKAMREAGKGVIGMKILGQGDMMQGEDRLAKARESIKFALGSGAVDMMVIGFESPQQVTEVISQTRLVMADLGMRIA